MMTGAAEAGVAAEAEDAADVRNCFNLDFGLAVFRA